MVYQKKKGFGCGKNGRHIRANATFRVTASHIIEFDTTVMWLIKDGFNVIFVPKIATLNRRQTTIDTLIIDGILRRWMGPTTIRKGDGAELNTCLLVWNNVYCAVNKNTSPCHESSSWYHTWVWNRGICMCVIVRPRSHMLIVLKK